ncbi:hypothetical protein C8Q77DRAFT_663560 [Trametes polyzona]|nr:hypothetical protein C8Q77DRAFT_663560 [Trametes polyzona]
MTPLTPSPAHPPSPRVLIRTVSMVGGAPARRHSPDKSDHSFHDAPPVYQGVGATHAPHRERGDGRARPKVAWCVCASCVHLPAVMAPRESTDMEIRSVIANTAPWWRFTQACTVPMSDTALKMLSDPRGIGSALAPRLRTSSISTAYVEFHVHRGCTRGRGSDGLCTCL